MHAGEELGVSAVRLPGALADPEHVRRAVVPVAGERVAARQALLVVEHEALVARPDVDLVQLRRVREVDPAGTHEADRPLDLRGDDLVALPFRRARDELLVPHLHLRQVGEAALREGAQQIERGRGLVVGLDHPLRIGRSRLRATAASSLTMCPKKDGSSSSPTRSTGSDRGFANCPAIRPTLTSGSADAVDHHHRHLQQDLQLLADRDRGEVAERLGAVAGLEQERPAGGDLAERGLQVTRLAGEDERRQRTRAARTAASAAAASGHSGWCSAGRSRQLEGVQVAGVTAIAPV